MELLPWRTHRELKHGTANRKNRTDIWRCQRPLNCVGCGRGTAPRRCAAGVQLCRRDLAAARDAAGRQTGQRFCGAMRCGKRCAVGHAVCKRRAAPWHAGYSCAFGGVCTARGIVRRVLRHQPRRLSNGAGCELLLVLRDGAACAAALQPRQLLPHHDVLRRGESGAKLQRDGRGQGSAGGFSALPCR